MLQIAIYGRGGQGVVKASQLLSQAAFNDGRYSQAFPFFGTERRGSPVYSYVRIDKKEIKIREHIYEADYLIILDSTLFNTNNIKAKKIVINSNKSFPNSISFDASEIAKDFPQALNTVMIAAFCALTGIISKEALIKACEIFSSLREKNIEIIKKVFGKCQR